MSGVVTLHRAPPLSRDSSRGTSRPDERFASMAPLLAIGFNDERSRRTSDRRLSQQFRNHEDPVASCNAPRRSALPLRTATHPADHTTLHPNQRKQEIRDATLDTQPSISDVEQQHGTTRHADQPSPACLPQGHLGAGADGLGMRGTQSACAPQGWQAARYRSWLTAFREAAMSLMRIIRCRGSVGDASRPCRR